MEAADLFDVLHVLYEEDITPLWEQHIDVKDRVREVIYPMLYKRPYKFSTTKAKRGGVSASGMSFEGPDLDGLPEDFGSSGPVKPFIPVTDERDLMKILDAPMGS